MAIDERRRMFRPNHWLGREYRPNPFDTSHVEDQDVKEVWFAGAHTDVGGGHEEMASGTAKLPFLWMVAEAKALGLEFNEGAIHRIGRGLPRSDSKRFYATPDALGLIHPQPSGAWWALEWLPKAARRREWPARRIHLGGYFPAAEPRYIPAGSNVHRSVEERYARDKRYRPPNLADKLQNLVIVDTAEDD